MVPIQTQYSMDTKALADHLRKTPVGGNVTYSEMSALISRDVQGKARGALDRARAVLLREGIRFDVVRDVGVRRMSDSEIAKSGARSVRLVSRTARREARRMHAVSDYESLTNEEKIQHNATLSVLGAVAHFSRPSQVKILEKAVEEARKSLPPKGAVDAIQRALTAKRRP